MNKMAKIKKDEIINNKRFIEKCGLYVLLISMFIWTNLAIKDIEDFVIIILLCVLFIMGCTMFFVPEKFIKEK